MSIEREVSFTELAFEKWWTARNAAAVAADLCGIDPPRIRWFSAPISRQGMVLGGSHGTVWVRADLTGEELVRTVGHEVRHALHFETGTLPTLAVLATPEATESAEADATAFEDDVLAAYCRAYGTP